MDIQNSIVALLNTENEIVGTGFVAADGLIVTCAHVIDLAKAAPGGFVRVRFAVDGSERFAEVEASAYSPKAELDVAILHVSQLPKGVQPLRMSASAGCSGHQFFATGYPKLGDFERLSARGEIISLEKDKRGDPYLQLRSQEVAPGMSGGPVMDVARNAVVGMVNSGFLLRADKKHRDTAFATPSETIWQVCPQLKPIILPLPRRNPIVEGINLLPYDYDQRIQNFLTEYLGTESHPVPFGGRDDALQMLDNWLAETTPYLLLAAPAGRGKSALLVRWLDSLKEREDLALAFVPVSIRFGTNMERVFYAALAARLAYLHGDDIPASPETSTAVYRGLVSDYLSKPLANGRTLLVVLDGLDEAADWQAGADFIPTELPAGVRVVVSARFLAGDADSTSWLRRLNWERTGLASAPSLTPLDHDGVRDVLFKMGCPLDELSRNVDIVVELHRLSAGDPLLVGLYVGDLWAKGEEVTRLKPENLADIEPGYNGYFDRWWDDQKKLWGKDKPWLEKHVRAVRNLLAGALGSLFKRDFQALDPELESDYIADALEVLQRFIIGDNWTQGFTFSHPKLGQYFWEALPPTEQAQVEECFLVWCERTFQEFVDGKRDPKKKAEVPVYVVQNYGAHLARANQPIEKWLPLIHYQQWAQAWFAVEGAYGGYSQDVQRVWEQCITSEKQTPLVAIKTYPLSWQIRCALIETSLHSLAGNIPAELVAELVRAKMWTLPQAWVFIRQMPESEQQANAIIQLIPVLDKAQLTEILAAAYWLKDKPSRTRVLCTLLQNLPEDYPELLSETLSVARTLSCVDDVLCAGAASLPNDAADFLDEALGFARATADPVKRAQVLMTLAPKFMDGRCLPMLIEALSTTRAIKNEMERLQMLTKLALKLSGEPQAVAVGDALAIARWISSEKDRARALTDLLPFLSGEKRLEVVDEGLAVARKIDEAYYEDVEQAEVYVLAGAEDDYIYCKGDRAVALAALTPYLPDEQRDTVFEEALLAAHSIDNEYRRALALSRLAPYLPEEKRKDAINEAIASIPLIVSNDFGAPGDDEITALIRDLILQVPAELLNTALSLATDKLHADDRLQTLMELASRLSGEQRESVLAEIRTSSKRLYEIQTLIKLALYFSGEQREILLAEALVSTRRSSYRDSQADVLARLASYSSPELLSEILKSIGSHGVCKFLDDLLLHIPVELLNDVLKLVRTLEADASYTEDAVKALAKLTPYLPDNQRKTVLIEALETAQGIASGYVLVEALKVVISNAEHVTRRERREILSRALKIARTIKDEKYREEALELITPGLGLAQQLFVAGEKFKKVQLSNWNWTCLELGAVLLLELLVAILFIPAVKYVVISLTLILLAIFPLSYVASVMSAMRNPESRAEKLIRKAKHLTEKRRTTVLLAALKNTSMVSNEYSRRDLLRSLIPQLPAELLDEALAVVQAIDVHYADHKAEALISLALRAPVQKQAAILTQALGAVRAIHNDSARTDALMELAPLLSNYLLADAILLAREISDQRNRAEALAALAANLPDQPRQEILTETMEIVTGIENAETRSWALKRLVKQLAKLTHEQLSAANAGLQAELRSLASRRRSVFLADLHAMIPFLFAAVPKNEQPVLAKEIFCAIQDVTTWWP